MKYTKLASVAACALSFGVETALAQVFAKYTDSNDIAFWQATFDTTGAYTDGCGFVRVRVGLTADLDYQSAKEMLNGAWLCPPQQRQA